MAAKKALGREPKQGVLLRKRAYTASKRTRPDRRQTVRAGDSRLTEPSDAEEIKVIRFEDALQGEEPVHLAVAPVRRNPEKRTVLISIDSLTCPRSGAPRKWRRKDVRHVVRAVPKWSHRRVDGGTVPTQETDECNPASMQNHTDKGQLDQDKPDKDHFGEDRLNKDQSDKDQPEKDSSEETNAPEGKRFCYLSGLSALTDTGELEDLREQLALITLGPYGSSSNDTATNYENVSEPSGDAEPIVIPSSPQVSQDATIRMEDLAPDKIQDTASHENDSLCSSNDTECMMPQALTLFQEADSGLITQGLSQQQLHILHDPDENAPPRHPLRQHPLRNIQDPRNRVLIERSDASNATSSTTSAQDAPQHDNFASSTTSRELLASEWQPSRQPAPRKSHWRHRQRYFDEDMDLPSISLRRSLLTRARQGLKKVVRFFK